MANRKFKTFFTQDELQEIIYWVGELEKADESKQKGIRDRLRKLGLRWSKVRPDAKYKYTVENLQRLFENGVLQLQGHSPAIKHTIQKEEAKEVPAHEKHTSTAVKSSGRETSDEYYVIDLCDEILGIDAKRQYRFDFLRGDSGYRLPVDAYYPSLNLVIEYHESQHSRPTPFYDNRQTVSGVSRGVQRRIYDERRQQVLPGHGIKLIIISYTDFGTTKKLNRNKVYDLMVVKNILTKNGIID